MGLFRIASFVNVWMAWFCFCAGLVNLVAEIRSFLRRIEESPTTVNGCRVSKALFISLWFALWYSLLFLKEG